MVDEEAKALLREIRDLLINQRDIEQRRNEKYDTYRDIEQRRNEKYDTYQEEMRQLYVEQHQRNAEQYKWYAERNKKDKGPDWKGIFFICIIFFLILTLGVFIGVLTGLRFATQI